MTNEEVLSDVARAAILLSHYGSWKPEHWQAWTLLTGETTVSLRVLAHMAQRALSHVEAKRRKG